MHENLARVDTTALLTYLLVTKSHILEKNSESGLEPGLVVLCVSLLFNEPLNYARNPGHS